jgi:hypothetical protein
MGTVTVKRETLVTAKSGAKSPRIVHPHVKKLIVFNLSTNGKLCGTRMKFLRTSCLIKTLLTRISGQMRKYSVSRMVALIITS